MMYGEKRLEVFAFRIRAVDDLTGYVFKRNSKKIPELAKRLRRAKPDQIGEKTGR